jgi:superfamily II DNA/RNA helicase
VTEDLAGRGFAVASVHGDLGQGQRERALRAFRNGKVDVLVATDVAARGLDVDDVTHVVNYECPEDEKAYLHRTGRTGRAGRMGIAVTFVDWRDMRRWKLIDEALGLNCPEPPEMYSTSAELFTELRIPETVTGTLPTAQRERAGLNAEAMEDIGETGRTRTPRAKTGGPRDKARSGRSRGSSRGGKGTPAGSAARGGSAADGGDGGQDRGQSGSGTRRRIRRRTRSGQDVSTNEQRAS